MRNGAGIHTRSGGSGPPNERFERLEARIRNIVGRHTGKPGALLSILEQVQDEDEHRHLSEEAMRLVARETGQALSRVYSVATFFSYFNLKPQGKNTIVVCRGTACHTRGSYGLLVEAMAKLGETDFREEEEASFTTPDKRFSVRTVACFGQCALAPVADVNGTIHSMVTADSLASIIDSLRKGRKL